MDVPGIVESVLEDEEIAAEVSLGGENALYVTPSRTLIYQSEGFLSDESVDEYAHDAQRMTVKEGRRKTRITLEYSLDGTEEFTVPSNATDDVVHPVLAGVLNASGVTDADETVTRTFRLDELTLVITSERLVKHVGNAVWDEDYEEYHFADVTGLDFEDGSVATQLVLEVDGRPERVKIANDRAAEVKEYLQRSLFSYYGVNSLDALNEAVAPEEPEETDEPAAVDFGEGVDPLDAGSTVQPNDGGDTAVPDPTPTRDDDQAGTEPTGTDQAGTDPTGTDQVAPGGTNAAAQGNDTDSGRGDGTQTDQQAGTQPAQQAETQRGQQSNQQTGTQPNQQAETQPDQGAGTDADGVTEAVDAPAADAAESSMHATQGSGTTEETTESSPTDVASAVDQAVDESDDGEGDSLPDSKFEEAGFQPATAAGDEELLERIETLEAQVEQQNELLTRQHDLLQQLVDELSRGR